MKPAKKTSLRGRLAGALQGAAMFVGGVGGYSAGRRDNRKMRSYRPGAGSPEADIHLDLPDLRGRARDLGRNSPIIAGARHTKVIGVIGTGLIFKSELRADVLGISADAARALEDKIEAEFELFSRECDFTRSGQHFRMQQRLMCRSGGENGDFGLARRWKRFPGQTYSTKLVLIEADRISNPLGRADGETVKGGVKLNNGIVEGYYVSDRHPGAFFGGALNWKFVSRYGPQSGMVQMVLPFEPLRIGQLRGVPDLAPVITTIKQLTDYSEAEVSAALNDAVLFAFQKLTPDDEAAGAGISDDSGTTAPAGAGEGEVEVDGRSLKIFDLEAASDIEVHTPARPNAQFDAFISAVLKYIGAALQIPFELLLMHFSASYSASRAAMELAWKAWQSERETLIIGAFDVVVEWFFVEAVATGRLNLPGFYDDPIKRAAWMAHLWVPPTRIQIDPVKEAKADETDIRNFVKTREQVITERTRGDWPRKFQQAKVEHDDLVAAGMTSGPVTGGSVRAKPAEKNSR